MYDGKRRDSWGIVSTILATLYNVHGVRVQPYQLNPYLHSSMEVKRYQEFWNRLQTARAMPTEVMRARALEGLLGKKD